MQNSLFSPLVALSTLENRLSFLRGVLPPLSFVFGVVLVQHLEKLPSLYWATVLIGVGVTLFYLPQKRRWIFIGLMFLFGFFYTVYRAEERQNTAIPSDLLSQKIIVEGKILTLPNINKKRTRFDFLISRIVHPVTLTVSVTARISDYHYYQPTLDIFHEGDFLQLPIKLRQPATGFNPHGFDYVGYLFAKNILFSAYLTNRDTIEILSPQKENGLRQKIRKTIESKQLKYGAIISALVIGDRSGLSDEDWVILRKTGTTHLLSVSGTHISLIFLIIVFIARLIWQLFPSLTRFAPTMLATMVIALPGAFFYAWLTGLGFPVQRSFLMLAMAVSITLCGGIFSPAVVLTLAMMIIVLIDPWAVTNVGFWLSFLLTAAVMIIAVSRRSGVKMLKQILFMQILISLFAIPVTLWFFNESSLISPLANIIAIPAIGLVVLPLSLLGAFIDNWSLANFFLNLLWHYLEFLSKLPFASYAPAKSPFIVFLLAVGGSVWLLLPRGIPLRFCGLLPIIAMLFWQNTPHPYGSLQMIVFDVGQGSSILLKTQNHTAIYDIGPDYAGRIIQDYLRGEGIRKIDKLIISHDDFDHRGGTAQFRDITDETLANDGDLLCNTNQQWEWDGVQFTILYPHSEQKLSSVRDNDSSCVLLIETANKQSILLTGDISSKIEEQLARQLKPLDILLVSHHGSKTSTSPHFLEQIQPQLSIISVGGRNSYGHPHPSVLARLNEINTRILRTDLHGAIDIHLEKEIVVKTWKQKRYWH